jgi:hypothetical protein
LLIARWRDDELAAGRMAVFALLARWLDEEGSNGDGALKIPSFLICVPVRIQA